MFSSGNTSKFFDIISKDSFITECEFEFVRNYEQEFTSYRTAIEINKNRMVRCCFNVYDKSPEKIELSIQVSGIITETLAETIAKITTNYIESDIFFLSEKTYYSFVSDFGCKEHEKAILMLKTVMFFLSNLETFLIST